MNSIFQQTTSRDLPQSVRTIIEDDSVQNLPDNNFKSSLPSLGLPQIEESKEEIKMTTEEARKSKKKLFKKIKDEQLFLITGKMRYKDSFRSPRQVYIPADSPKKVRPKVRHKKGRNHSVAMPSLTPRELSPISTN